MKDLYKEMPEAYDATEELMSEFSECNSDINLVEILTGHEGEFFYSPIYKYPVEFTRFYKDENKEIAGILIKCPGYHETLLNLDGTLVNGEMMLYPAKDQRSWKLYHETNNL